MAKKKATLPQATPAVRNYDPHVDPLPWRHRIREGKIKFDDVRKMIFLNVFSAIGAKGKAAAAAGVTVGAINQHLEKDREFNEAYLEAELAYRDSIADSVRIRGHIGWLEPIYQKGQRVLEPELDENGNAQHDDMGNLIWKPASIRKFSDRLLELEAKRVDHGYRDKATIDLNTAGGGVLVAPPGMTPAQWIDQQTQENDAPTIDHE